MSCLFIGKKETERNEWVMIGRKRIQATFGIVAGVYPDFYGWKYYWFVSFLGVIEPTLYTYFIVLYFYSFFIAVVYADIDLISQTLVVGTITLIYFMVSVFFISKKSQVDEVLEMIGKGLSRYSRPPTEREKELEFGMDRETKRYAVASTVLLISIALVHMALLPALKAYRGQYSSITNTTAPINSNTPLPVWTFWETDNFEGFIAALFFELISGCIEYAIINACVIMFVGLSQQLARNMTILVESLRDIHSRAMYLLEGTPYAKELALLDKYDLYKNEIFLDCLNECLRENLIHHNTLIRFRHKVQGIVGFSILAILTGNAVIISTSAYSILLAFEKGGETEIFVTNIVVWSFYLVVYTFLLAVYCYYGQQVTDVSGTIIEALYDTPWLEGDLRFRKSVLIAMSFALKNIKIESMGGLVTPSYETLLHVLQTSFSYLNVLLASR